MTCVSERLTGAVCLVQHRDGCLNGLRERFGKVERGIVLLCLVEQRVQTVLEVSPEPLVRTCLG